MENNVQNSLNAANGEQIISAMAVVTMLTHFKDVIEIGDFRWFALYLAVIVALCFMAGIYKLALKGVIGIGSIRQTRRKPEDKIEAVAEK